MTSAPAQTDLVPRGAGYQVGVYAIRNARVFAAPQQEIEDGTVVIRDGLIHSVGKNVPLPPDAEVIDGTGLVVYAGFIDAGTSAFLDPAKAPIPQVGRAVDFSRYALAATAPDNRKGLTPEFDAEQGLKYDLPQIEARRKLGFTALHMLPAGRIASGRGVLISTSGAPLRESIMRNQTLSEFQLFSPHATFSTHQAGYPATLMGATAHLRQAFLDARRHAQHQKLYADQAGGISRPAEDAVLDALAALVEKKQPLLFAAQSRDDILRALDFSVEQQLPAIIWGGKEATACVDRLRAPATSVIMQVDWGDEPKIEPEVPSEKLNAKPKDPLRVQQDRLDRWRARVGGLKALHDSGIRFAFSSEGLKEPADLLKGIRQAIKAGLPRDAALAALTSQAASIVGQEQHLGTLAAGKAAHLTVLSAPFDDEQATVRYLFADGLKYEYNKPTEPAANPAGTKPGIASLTGTWQLEIQNADGNVPATLDLSHSGNALSGTFKSLSGEGKVKSGALNGDQLELVVAIGAGAQSIELKFSGKIELGKLDTVSGVMKSPFGPAAKWSGFRKPAPTPAVTAPQTAAARTPPAKNPVEIKIDDADNDDKPLKPAAPADATQPDNAKHDTAKPDPKTVATEFPTELESDRRQRHLETHGNLLIEHATILAGVGEPLVDSSLLIQKGKIAAIGREVKGPPGIAVINAAGRFVMPGVIDSHSHIMIAGGVAVVNEATQSIVCEVRIKDTLRSDDPDEYRALAGGVTTARILHGSANVIGGQDAVVKLKYGAPTSEQRLEGNPQGVKFALGENVKFQSQRFPNTRLGVEATLNRAFMEAVDYRRQWLEYRRDSAKLEAAAKPLLPPRRDLRLDALADIVEHQKFIHCHCYRADEILMLLRVADSLGIRVWSLQHVLEGYKVAPEIAAHKASCSTFSDWWAYKIEAYDATPYNAALLNSAGASVVIKSDDAELIRHLPMEAAKTIRYGGMPVDKALAAVTLNPAREIGLQARMGSIEVGKDADLAIFNGHPLSSFSRCEVTIIEGEVYFLREKQPSAMSATGLAATAAPKPLVLPPQTIRDVRLDLTVSPKGQYAIKGATVHPVDGPDIAAGTVLVDQGKIAAVGASVAIPEGVRVIDAAGLHVYPGLIDAGTILGLYEIGKDQETHDYHESGLFQPDLRAGVAVNPDSELIPVARAGGITTALIHPTGGIIAGQCSLMKLAGWTVPEMVFDFEAALQINWPFGNDAPAKVEQLRDFLEQGRVYHRARSAAQDAKTSTVIADPRFDALGPYLRGEKRVFIEANARQEIAEALLFAEKEKLKIAITGGADAWKLAAELKVRDVPVIVGPVMRHPVSDHDPFDATYANPGRLFEAGVLFCIRSNNAANSRNAPFEAAIAVAYGLPEVQGLKAVTLSAAKILKIDDRLGSLTAGKIANLIITDGSPLQPTTQYKAIFVGGQPFAPESRHTRLYEKYQKRLTDAPKKP